MVLLSALNSSRLSFVTAVLLLPFARMVAQSPKIHFDVVSIKQSHSGVQTGSLQIVPGGDRVVLSNAPMYRIIAFAFDRQRNDLIEGVPAWAREDRWDIDAKIAEEDAAAFHALTFVEQKAMLQTVLMERCKMQVHLGKKEVPVYALVVSKGGFKMRKVKPPGPDGSSHGWDLTLKHGEIHGHAARMEALLYALSGVSLSRQVIDRSGLTGVYDFDLVWKPEDDADAADSGTGESSLPSIFTAIQEQLGLRLDAIRAVVDAVFVDHIERPSTN